MRFPLLLYYIRRLIEEGHKWQYQNATNSNVVSWWPFSLLQCVAILIAGLFVYRKTGGFSETSIDLLLSSLSIITGFLVAVSIIVFDKYKQLPQKANTDVEKINLYKSHNFLIQYNALSMYAILLAFVCIIMLILCLLFGENVDLKDFSFAESISEISMPETITGCSIVLYRFLLCYFIFDFFIITIYSICSLFSFIDTQMRLSDAINSYKPRNTLSDYQTYRRKYSIWPVFWVFCLILFMLIGYYYLVEK